MRKVTLLMVILVSVLLHCSHPPYGFTANNLYSREKFTGVDLNGRLIGVGPILKKSGHDTVQFLSSDSQYQTLRKFRKDLKLVSTRQIEENFLKKWDRDSLNFLYNKLFENEVVVLQNRDSLWDAVTCNFFMVIRMRSGSSVKTFENKISKRLHFEAELWDCRNRETVWRTSILGINHSKKIPDSQFMMEAVRKAYGELPIPLPSNNEEHW